MQTSSARPFLPALLLVLAGDWAAPLAAGETSGAAAQLQAQALPRGAVTSPDGNRAVWIDEQGSGFWAAERSAGGRWGERRHILSIRGLVRNPVFAPDGNSFAFENLRGGHATGPYGPARHHNWGYVATFDFGRARISYVDPSFGRDVEPSWSSDGRQISFTRLLEGVPDRQVTAFAPTHRPPAAASSFASEGPPIDAFLGAPLVYQPAASEDGHSFAFVAREARVRSIYFVRGGKPPVALARYADDDGQELSEVAVSRGGELVAYVRGGAPNGEGEIPNPRSLPQMPVQQLWIVDTESRQPRLLGAGSAPRFSPDGERLIWLTERGVMTAPLTSAEGGRREVGAPEPLLAGAASTLRFSPDGRRLTFERAGHVEILDLATRRIWGVPKPAEATDAGPVWSPNGRELAFRRIIGPQPPRLGDGYAGEFVSKEPWEIWVADAESRQVRRVWKAKPGRGSAYYALDQDPSGTGPGGDQLFWSTSGAIAFVWEADGWRHLYAVPEAGGEAMLLTPGDGEVETAALSRDGADLIFSTNRGDLHRRHLARVPVSGGAVEALTSGSSSQWAPTPLAAGNLAYIEAGWSRPPRVMVKLASGRASTIPAPAIPADFPSASMVEPRPVEFPGADGQTAYGQLFTPKKSRGCGIIFVHGGIRRQMLPGFHYMDVYSNLYELNQYFASRGCAVLSVEYRSSIMHGYAFRNAPGWGSAGASEHQDVLGAVTYLRSQKQLGIRKLGIHGLSWGGYLVAQALARNSDLFDAGLDMAGVHEFTGAGFPHSPAAFVENWRSPIYLAFGDDDRNVDFNQGVMLAQALRSRRPQVELVEHVVPNETHDLYLTFETLVDVYGRGSDFLLKRLRSD